LDPGGTPSAGKLEAGIGGTPPVSS
jgi:hypothetical protein